MMNALANHGVLPHNGKGITKEMAVDVLVKTINLDSKIANVFASKALTSNPDHSQACFDLDQIGQHGLIEHDVSLSRNDYHLGDQCTYDEYIWDQVKEIYGDSKETTFELQTRARWARFIASKKAHEAAEKDFQYGIKEFILSYGESALILGLLGDPEGGKVPIEYIRVLFEEERLPYKEGWRPSERPITQMDMNHMIFSLIKANEHRGEEAAEVGLGTIHAVTAAVHSLLPTFCTVM